MYNHQLDAFMKTADSGSFSKAASALYISTPAVVQQINLLEKHCGFKLFERSNHGARLTPVGQVVYKGAKMIIQLSHDTMAEARQVADASETTVRVGTALLFRCRMIPDLWSQVQAVCPELRIELVPIRQTESSTGIADLGTHYDIREGIFCTAVNKGKCGHLELMRTPICCAVSQNHRLAKIRKLHIEDLREEDLVMPISGVSEELDAFRSELLQMNPKTKIIESSYYDVDTFTMCEINPYVLITQQIYSDIHPNLVTIPLETEYSLSYGLDFSLTPTPAVKKFISAVKHVSQSIV